MSTQEYHNVSPIDAINVIKQKQVQELDYQDFDFLKAHEDLLSDADKKMYFEGKSADEAHADSGAFMDRNARIAHENRFLQDMHVANGRQPNGAPIAESFTPTQEIDKEKNAKEWKDKVTSLKKESEKAKVEADKAAKDEEKARSDKEKEDAKATPVKIVS